MKKNCYMASIDLKDAYYTVPVALEHRKYLRFFWRNRLFQYTCLPNGLASAPRYFTKLLKPVYSTLRSQGYLNVGYIDDSYLQGDSKTECRSNILTTLKLLESLGFLINHEKSVLQPCQKLAFLGFLLDSVNMKVFLTAEKREKIILVCQQLLKKSVISIREVAHVIGLLVSSLPAVQHGPLFYRSLEIDKNVALQENNGNYDASMTLSSESVSDLNWWMTAPPSAMCLVSSTLRQTKAPDSLTRELSGSSNLAYFLRLLPSLVLLRLTCLHADLTTNFQNMFLGNLTLEHAMWMLFRFPGVESLFTFFLHFLCLIDVCRNWKTIRL